MTGSSCCIVYQWLPVDFGTSQYVPHSRLSVVQAHTCAHMPVALHDVCKQAIILSSTSSMYSLVRSRPNSMLIFPYPPHKIEETVPNGTPSFSSPQTNQAKDAVR